jgi:hypothetical protein
MKNLIWSIATCDDDYNFRNIFSVSRMYKHGFITRLLEDGEYPFFIKECSSFSIDKIPENSYIEMKVMEQYPQFTEQTIRGTFKVKNGKIDLRHLDKQIPTEFGEYNPHVFLEGFSDLFSKECRILLGS